MSKLSKAEKILKILNDEDLEEDNLENSVIGKVEEPKPVVEPEPVVEKPKRKMSEKQLEVLKQAREKRLEILRQIKEEKEALKALPKPKKPASEIQLQNLKKGQEIRAKLIEEKKKQEELLELKRKQDLEEKIVKKAINIKKKQIKEEAILEAISDDDNDFPIEKVKEIAKKTAIRKEIKQKQVTEPKIIAPLKEVPASPWSKFNFL